MTDVNKTVTYDEDKQITTRSLKQAVLDTSAFLAPFIDKVSWSKGKLLYPILGVAKAGEVTHIIDGLLLTKIFDTSTRKIVKETLEDAHPAIGMEGALNTLMAQQVTKDIEKKIIDLILADTNIPVVVGAGVDWTGIKSIINDLGPDVYTTEGRFVVTLSLSDYLAIVGVTEFKRAMDSVGGKLVFAVSSQLTAGQMIVFHEHGLAGSLETDKVEVDSSPASDSAELVAPFKTAVAYDTDYIRVVK